MMTTFLPLKALQETKTKTKRKKMQVSLSSSKEQEWHSRRPYDKRDSHSSRRISESFN
jgi:hypothetical protein